MGSLADAILAAEGVVQRPLTDDEIVMVSRMHQSGKDAADIVKMFNAPVPDPVGEETHRYEPGGPNTARRIP